MKPTFLAIGDIVSEPFIRLTDAQVSTDPETGTQTLSMRFGDKIPYESATLAIGVGNAPNAAVSAARLGVASALHTYVGDDRYGEECREHLQKEGIDDSLVITEPGKKTNYHYVLWYGSERTILVKHETFSYEVPVIPDSVKWVYLSSLADNSLPYHLALMDALEKRPDIHLVFQPGTFQMKLGAQALERVYKRTHLFFCNKEEAQRILGAPDENDVRALMENLRALGPKHVVVTDGREGAYALFEDTMVHVPMYPDTREPKERTGAGDAFASTVAAALSLGEPFEKALLWGPVNSMAVVQEIGAQEGLLSRADLETYLEKAPKEYVLTPLT